MCTASRSPSSLLSKRLNWRIPHLRLTKKLVGACGPTHEPTNFPHFTPGPDSQSAGEEERESPFIVVPAVREGISGHGWEGETTKGRNVRVRSRSLANRPTTFLGFKLRRRLRIMPEIWIHATLYSHKSCPCGLITLDRKFPSLLHSFLCTFS